MIGSEYPALFHHGQAIGIEAPFGVGGAHNLEAACCCLVAPDMRRDWLQWQLSATPLAWFAALREKVSDSLIFVNDLSGMQVLVFLMVIGHSKSAPVPVTRGIERRCVAASSLVRRISDC
jgi:hypothetical protein